MVMEPSKINAVQLTAYNNLTVSMREMTKKMPLGWRRGGFTSVCGNRCCSGGVLTAGRYF
jgi:hypothetical protein